MKIKICSDDAYKGLMNLCGAGQDYLETGTTFEFEIDTDKKVIVVKQYPDYRCKDCNNAGGENCKFCEENFENGE